MGRFELLRERLAAIQHRKEQEREDRIDLLVQGARARGEDDDRIFWSIVHDLEEAPPTTNRKQLKELGYHVPVSAEIQALSARTLYEALWSLIEVLSLLRVYLYRTDHLDDRALIERLVERIIEEPVPDLPLCVGTRDWIDLAGGTGPQGRDPEAEAFAEAPPRRDHLLPRPGDDRMPQGARRS